MIYKKIKIDFMEEYSFLEYSFFVEIRSKTICNMNINVIIHVIAQCREIIPTRHLERSVTESI